MSIVIVESITILIENIKGQTQTLVKGKKAKYASAERDNIKTLQMGSRVDIADDCCLGLFGHVQACGGS